MRNKSEVVCFFAFFTFLYSVCYGMEVVVERKQSTMVISDNEELHQKAIGPLNKYELLDSLQSYFKSDKKESSNNLILIYDSNL